MTTDDPRVSGTETPAPWNLDMWGTSDNAAGVQWGTTRIENAAGAWEGTGSGVGSTVPGDIIANWYKGTGAYAGLGYFALWTGLGPWTIRGLIFPGDPPNLASMPAVAAVTQEPTAPGSPSATLFPLPSAIAYGPVSMVAGTFNYKTMELGMTSTGPGGVTHYSNAVAAGVETANDPRVSVSFTGAPFTIDLWGTFDEGAAVQWGPGRDENSGGTWDCIGSGIRDSRGDTIVNWCRGTGGYAGLAYFELITSIDPFDLLNPPGDVAIGTIHGEIYPGNPPTP